jgi:hypothetical protein
MFIDRGAPLQKCAVDAEPRRFVTSGYHAAPARKESAIKRSVPPTALGALHKEDEGTQNRHGLGGSSILIVICDHSTHDSHHYLPRNRLLAGRAKCGS